jgi:pimeloyl-ACP methyl ester carboxylesterase
MTDTRYLNRPGGRLAYDVAGAGPLVVCVPGMGDLRGTYRHLTPALLDAGYRVATVDLRGHGESDVRFPAYDDEALAGDVAALIRELGGSAVVVGNSMGSSAAALLAAREPHLVRGLVLCSPFLREGDVSFWRRAMFRAAAVRWWVVPAWFGWLPKLYAGRVPADHAGYLASVKAAFRRPGAAAALAQTMHTSHAVVEAALPQVGTPAQVVVGLLDKDWPDPTAEGRWCADVLGAELVLVPEAGHYPAAQRPDLVAPAVLGFLARVSERA